MTTDVQHRRGKISDHGARLSPGHRNVLHGYGLNDSTIDEWGCFSVSQDDLTRNNFAPGVQAPGIALPILQPGHRKAAGFLYRPDHPRETEKNGKKRKNKYENAVGALNHVHVPLAVQAPLFGQNGEIVRVLVITEGPIKAEAAAQAGIDCVALMGGVHFHGPTSTGKSTALVVGGSVCGGGGPLGFVESWRATANGLEAVAAAHNDAGLFLDELSQVDARDAAEIAYLLGNGQGKARMERSIVARKRLRWKLLFVSAGEMTLAEHAASAGKRTRGGADVRLLNIEADAGAEMGMFENLHGTASPDVFANQLKAAAKRYYGAVIRKFLHWLVRHRVAARKFVRAMQKEIQDSVPQDATGEVCRAAGRFGLIGAAGELATRLGLTGWRKGEAMDAAKRILSEWLSNRETAGPSDADAGVNAVRAFILERGASRFQSWQRSPDGGRPETIRDRAGFRRDEVGEPTKYYIFPETFRNEVCKGLPYKEVLKTLDARGFLRREPPNMTMKPNLPGVGRTRVYCVLSSILEGDES